MRKHKRKKLKNPINSQLSELYTNFTIINERGEEVAVVIDVLNFGAGDILHILPIEFKNVSNGKDNTLMIPMIKEALLKIDKDNKIIVINEDYKI